MNKLFFLLLSLTLTLQSSVFGANPPPTVEGLKRLMLESRGIFQSAAREEQILKLSIDSLKDISKTARNSAVTSVTKAGQTILDRIAKRLSSSLAVAQAAKTGAESRALDAGQKLVALEAQLLARQLTARQLAATGASRFSLLRFTQWMGSKAVGVGGAVIGGGFRLNCATAFLSVGRIASASEIPFEDRTSPVVILHDYVSQAEGLETALGIKKRLREQLYGVDPQASTKAGKRHLAELNDEILGDELELERLEKEIIDKKIVERANESIDSMIAVTYDDLCPSAESIAAAIEEVVDSSGR